MTSSQRRQVSLGFQPERYSVRWQAAFEERIRATLRPGMRILDVGSGRRPALSISDRPSACFYAGLDLSEEELVQAPPGSYDAIYICDIVKRQDELKSQFDLVVSWQVFEHVKPLRAAFDNVAFYLKPSGHFIAQFSGAFSLFGLSNRIIPRRLGMLAMNILLHRDPKTVFPAYYDSCWYGAIARLLSGWKCVDIVPRYRGGSYVRFAPFIQMVYLRYESWAEERGHRNLATHYIVDAVCQ